MDTVKLCRSLLERSGWRLDVFSTMVAGVVQWRVIANNGNKRIVAYADTRPDAWLKAVEQAKALGLLRE
jgi:hypothetical protein